MSQVSAGLPRHRNNVGLLRLVLASLVVLGHAAEVRGGPLADPLHRATGTVFVAGSCVFGFFLISGYLIAQSMDRTRAVTPFLGRRALRIVPGFVVAYLLSAFVIAPALGAAVRPFTRSILVNLLFLHEPPLLLGDVEPVYRTVNGSLWTISYEARCYVLTAVLGAAGLLRRRALVVALTAVACVATILVSDPAVAQRLDGHASGRLASLLIGMPHWDVIYGATFLVGTTVYLYREEIVPRLSAGVAAVAAAMLLACLRSQHAALVALILLGAPVIFWVGWRARLGPLQRINDEWDVSYGTYLYGWPAMMVVEASAPSLSPFATGIASLLLAWACGAASWWGVEQWFRWPSRKPARVRLSAT